MKLSTLLTALPSLVSAELGTGPGPSSQSTLFYTDNRSPNATGTVFLIGVNMTESPNTLVTASWTASLNVTEVAADTTNASSITTNTVLSLNAKGNWVESNDTAWNSCIVVLGNVERNATVKGQDDKGDCGSVWGKNCSDEWAIALDQARAMATRRNGTGGGACRGLVVPEVPSSCKGSVRNDGVSVIDITNFNSSSLDGYSPFIYDSEGPHDISNKTYYETAVTRIWPLALIQSPKSSFDGGAGFTQTKLSCLRATNVTTGSQAIGDVPGAGSRVKAGGLGLVIVAVVALIL